MLAGKSSAFVVAINVLVFVTVFCSCFRAKADNGDSQEKISGSVDMEEIFKQVLENASKALMESDAEKQSKTNLVSSPSYFPEEFQIQKAASSSLRQHESDSSRIGNNIDSNPVALPNCDQLIQPYVVRLLSNLKYFLTIVFKIRQKFYFSVPFFKITINGCQGDE